MHMHAWSVGMGGMSEEGELGNPAGLLSHGRYKEGSLGLGLLFI